MTKLLTLCAFTIAMAANTAMAENNPAYEMYYQVGNARLAQDKASQAILAAVKGDKVFKCQTVEASVNKTGTSIGMKNIKRSK